MTARITANAELKTLASDKQVVNFNVAINDRYKSGSETKEITTYVQCAYWKNPGIAQYLTKGTLVELQGRIGVNAYVNMQGEPKASLTFHVNSIKLHGGSKPVVKNNTAVTSVVAGELTEPLEDLPF
ncbi:MAG: single-stranded DNA-binding protein [Bacteroidota bacterium]